MKKVLANVKSASICLTNDIFLSFSIDVEYEDFGHQDIGHIILCDPNPNKDMKDPNMTRIGTAYGAEMIRRLFLFFGVDDLSKVRNQYIYVIKENNDWNSKAIGIENVGFDVNKNRLRYIMFKEVFEEFNVSNKGN